MIDEPFPAPEWVHFSNLKNMALSPAHYLASLARGESTKAMTMGTLVHSLLLGGQEAVVFDGPVRRGKAWDAFQAEHEGDLIVTRKELDAAQRMADSVMRNRDACDALKGDHEVSHEWRVLGGRKAAGRIDVIGSHFVTDLKTTRFSKPEWFSGESLRRKYHAQLAWYIDGLAMPSVKDAYIVAVESAPPYAVTVFKLTQRALDDGRKLIHGWMERLLQCEAANVWPAYVDSVVELDVPEEVEMDFEDEDEEQEAA